jgi:hypothetical protein
MTILFQYRIYPTAGGNQTVWSTTLPIVSSTGGAITSSSTGILETIEISNLITTVTSAQSPYTVLLTAGTIACNTSIGALTINLPDATLVLNCIYYFTNTGSNSVTIVPFGTQTIDGNTPYVLSSTGNRMIALQSYDGGVWTQYIDASTADLELTVNSTSIIKNKTITDFTNNVVGFLRPGNTIVVDTVYGNDVGASRGGLPFATLSMALTLAQSGDTIWLLPGTQTLTAPVILATGVSIIGINNKTCIINYAASVTTTMFTMGNNTRIDNVTMNLTSSTSNITLVCILFPDLTAINAKISSSVINVTNTSSNIVIISGVYLYGYGIPSDGESPAISDTTIIITTSSAVNGSCRGINVGYVTNAIPSNQVYINNCNILVKTDSTTLPILAVDAYAVNANEVILILQSTICKAIGPGSIVFNYSETGYGKIITNVMKTALDTTFNNNNLICNNGTFTCSGNISTNAVISSVGNITSTSGNIACTTGTITSSGNISTNSAISSVGDITSSTGNITCTAGTISSGGNISTNSAINSVGDITSTTGNLILNTGTISSNGNISTTNGAISSVGDITSTTGNLILNTGDVIMNHIIGKSLIPYASFVKGNGAGTTATISVSPATTGTDLAGVITVVASGTFTVSVAIVTVTFTKPYTGTPYIGITAGNAATIALSSTKTPFATATATNFSIMAGTAAMTAGTYKWFYQVFQ